MALKASLNFISPYLPKYSTVFVSSERAAASFWKGDYQDYKLESDLKAFRYHGPNNQPQPNKWSWLTNLIGYENEGDLRKGLALLPVWKNSLIEQISAYLIPKGTTIALGKAAPQNEEYPGGDPQIVIFGLPHEWLELNECIFNKINPEIINNFYNSLEKACKETNEAFCEFCESLNWTEKNNEKAHLQSIARSILQQTLTLPSDKQSEAIILNLRKAAKDLFVHWY